MEKTKDNEVNVLLIRCRCSGLKPRQGGQGRVNKAGWTGNVLLTSLGTRLVDVGPSTL